MVVVLSRIEVVVVVAAAAVVLVVVGGAADAVLVVVRDALVHQPWGQWGGLWLQLSVHH